VIVGNPTVRARALLDYCDGLEDGGLVNYAAKARIVARDAVELVEIVEVERSARVPLQRRIEALEGILRGRVEAASAG
jgi:hypothetical protein